MRKATAFITALCMALVLHCSAQAAGFGGGAGGGGGGTPGGTNGQIQYNNSGSFGGKDISQLQSPFAPAGFANVSTFSDWSDLVVSPAGDYVYVGGKLASNSHGAIAKVKITDGTTVASVDLGASVKPFALAISPDGASIYALDGNGPGNTTWWKVATSAMTLTHTSTLAVSQVDNVRQQFDLSPDGTVFAYVSGADAKLYMINTSTYAVTNQTMSHTAGNLTAVCFYNGSNSNVYVAHAGSGVVDLYAIGGAYTSSVSTGAGGTPAFNAMRSGINGNFFIADSGTNKELIRVASGSPSLIPTGIIGSLAVNVSSPTAISDGTDIGYIQTNGSFFQSAGGTSLAPMNTTSSVLENGASGIALLPGSSENIFTLSGVNYPEVWCLGSGSQTDFQDVGSAGAIPTSNGRGFLVSTAPYFTSADQTITTAGALTIAHGLPYTPGSVWFALVNQSTEAGYTAGQVVFIGGSQTVSVVAVQNDGFSAIVDGTNLTIRYGSDASTFTIPHATTGAATAITNNKWKCRFFAR